MNIKLLSNSYAVRQLNESDVEMIYDLSHRNSLFYQYHPPFVTTESILDDMKALPPGKTYADKYYIGFFDNKNLVAIMDLILAYPTEEIAFIGFLMTDIDYQNKGIGSEIINDISSYLKSLGYKKIRIGVDKSNPQSYRFWTKNNFNVIKENEYILMEKELVTGISKD